MTDADEIAKQIVNARKARAHHLEFARKYRRLIPTADNGPLYDDYYGQFDWHRRQAKKWRICLRQLEAQLWTT